MDSSDYFQYGPSECNKRESVVLNKRELVVFFNKRELVVCSSFTSSASTRNYAQQRHSVIIDLKCEQQPFPYKRDSSRLCFFAEQE